MTPESSGVSTGTIIILVLAAIGILIWLVHSNKVLAQKLGSVGDFLDDFKMNKSNVAATAAPATAVDHAAVVTATAEAIAAAVAAAKVPAPVAAAPAAPAAPATAPATAPMLGGGYAVSASPEEAAARVAQQAKEAANLAAAGGAGDSGPPGYDLDASLVHRNWGEPAGIYHAYTFTITDASRNGKPVMIEIMTATDANDGGFWTSYLERDGVIVAPPSTYNATPYQNFIFPSAPGKYAFYIKRDRAGGVGILLNPNG